MVCDRETSLATFRIYIVVVGDIRYLWNVTHTRSCDEICVCRAVKAFDHFMLLPFPLAAVWWCACPRLCLRRLGTTHKQL